MRLKRRDVSETIRTWQATLKPPVPLPNVAANPQGPAGNASRPPTRMPPKEEFHHDGESFCWNPVEESVPTPTTSRTGLAWELSLRAAHAIENYLDELDAARYQDLLRRKRKRAPPVPSRFTRLRRR